MTALQDADAVGDLPLAALFRQISNVAAQVSKHGPLNCRKCRLP